MSTEEKAIRAGEELVKRDVITREELTQAREREAATGTPWYRQLLQMRKASFGVLEEIFLREFHPKALREEHSRLGDTLVAMKIISKDQLTDALGEQNRNGRLLGNILLEKGTVTRETITRALAKQSGMEFAELDTTSSDSEALECVPENIARRNSMLPVRLEGDKLTVLIPHPQARDALNSVGVLLGKRIYPILTSSDDIRSEVTKRYHEAKLRIGRQPQLAPAKNNESKPVEPVIKETKTMENDKISDVARFEEIAREASGVPVIKLVTTIIEGAVNSGATDVHLDPQEPEMRVRYRIDGVLHDVMSIPPDVQNAVVSRIKIMSDIDITETRHPQDGHISMEIGDSEYDIRVATLPTYLGERIVLRLLDQTSVLAGVKDLGLDPDDEEKLTNLIKQPYGMILVTGPTGSGKTTTLYAALNQKNVMTDSIVTLEDPVEYQLSGINQVQIDAEIGLTFANTLRASLRQDIDVLLVGEIRDPDTARIAIRAAMTGHLVFSTLHTNDAAEAISTLRNMGIPSYLLASALTAVIGQRLVRKICANCREAFIPSKTLLKEIGLPESTKKLYRGKGCQLCYHTGCKGRTGIFEILDINADIRKLINLDKSIEEIIKASKMKSLADRCRAKVKSGIIAPEEFLRTIRI